MNTSAKLSKQAMLLSMLIFGTIGIFRKYIPLSSSMLAMLRGFIGMAFLILLVNFRHMKISWTTIKQNGLLLIVSGILIGLNWILLFEAYQYTSVAVATLCYYMAPIIVILCSPILFREKITPLKLLCVVCAFVGMICVSGVLTTDALQLREIKGILLGLGAACLYAAVILLNKKMGDIGAYDKTIVQLGAAAIVLLPYNLLVTDFSELQITGIVVLLVAIVGIVHTGIAYVLYFGSMKYLKTQTVALYSYIDPVTAILLSLIVFRENIGFWGILGAILILGSTMASDLLD